VGFTRFSCGFGAIRAVMSLFASTIIGFLRPSPLPTSSLPPPQTPHAPRRPLPLPTHAPPPPISPNVSPSIFSPRKKTRAVGGGGGAAGRRGSGVGCAGATTIIPHQLRNILRIPGVALGRVRFGNPKSVTICSSRSDREKMGAHRNGHQIRAVQRNYMSQKIM
jgi:hypothetical protein